MQGQYAGVDSEEGPLALDFYVTVPKIEGSMGGYGCVADGSLAIRSARDGGVGQSCNADRQGPGDRRYKSDFTLCSGD